MKKKTIAILSGRLEAGGAERAASNLSITLSQNFNVILIVFSGENITYPYGGTLIDLHGKREYNKLERISLTLDRIRKIRKIKKEYNVDYSISLLSAPNLINCLTRINDKVITSYRNYMSIARRSIFDKISTKFVDRHSDKIISLSKMTEIDLIESFGVNPNNVMTIYNSCDPDLLKKLAEDTSYSIPEYRYIITTGRLMYQKGQWHLIRAFKLIHDKISDLHLIILGEGEMRKSLENLSKRVGLEKYIHFLGYEKNPHKYMYNAEAFVFSSIYEGLGNVLLEALACGLPIVSTDCLAGPREILSSDFNPERAKKQTDKAEFNDYGILVPPFPLAEPDFENIEPSREEKIMAEAVVVLLNDPTLIKKYKTSAQKRIMDFSPELINKQWIDMLNSL